MFRLIALFGNCILWVVYFIISPFIISQFASVCWVVANFIAGFCPIDRHTNTVACISLLLLYICFIFILIVLFVDALLRENILALLMPYAETFGSGGRSERQRFLLRCGCFVDSHHIQRPLRVTANHINAVMRQGMKMRMRRRLW